MYITRKQWQRAIDIIRNDYDIRVRKFPATFATKSSSQCWNKSNQCIKLGTKDPPWLVLDALAHELGHCLSVRQGSKVKKTTYMLYRLGFLRSRRQKENVLKEERQAWRLGFAWLRQHQFPITEQMQRARKLLFNSHVKNQKGYYDG